MTPTPNSCHPERDMAARNTTMSSRGTLWLRRCARNIAAALIFVGLAATAYASASTLDASGLDAGYRAMYNLQFDAAHAVFADWQRNHPDDPLAAVSDAAAYLFSEFNRLHILELEFFTDDKNFEGRNELQPDPAVRQRFFTQLERAQQIIAARLARNAGDKDALFARVLALGLRGDYEALIEKKNMAGLSDIKQGRSIAQQLLTLCPDCNDAYLAVGVENYLLSLKPAPVRWFLHMTGAQTDKETGLANLRRVADNGHYLQPYARLLLAVAALRDHDTGSARALLSGLAQEFPATSLYTRELAKLK